VPKAVISIPEARDSAFEFTGFWRAGVHSEIQIHSIGTKSIEIEDGIEWIPSSNPLDSGFGMNASGQNPLDSAPEMNASGRNPLGLTPESSGF
jgi:hypothetical protein